MTHTFARAAHGTASDGGALTVTESKPWDEAPEAARAAPPIARKTNGQPATSADARRLAQMPRRPRQRVPEGARAYRRSRAAELQRAHGHVSAGVAAMLDAEACAWLAGSKAAKCAAETGDREDIASMTKAFDLARGLAKDAWSLCAFEAETKAAPAGSSTSADMRRRILGEVTP